MYKKDVDLSENPETISDKELNEFITEVLGGVPISKMDFDTGQEKEDWIYIYKYLKMIHENGIPDREENPDIERHIELVYKAMAHTVMGENAKATYTFNDPLSHMGCVHVVGKGLIIPNPTLFSKLSKVASVFEVYPKVDGTVQADFGFYKYKVAQKEGK